MRVFVVFYFMDGERYSYRCQAHSEKHAEMLFHEEEPRLKAHTVIELL